jgi:hypothetical protein
VFLRIKKKNTHTHTPPNPLSNLTSPSNNQQVGHRLKSANRSRDEDDDEEEDDDDQGQEVVARFPLPHESPEIVQAGGFIMPNSMGFLYEVSSSRCCSNYVSLMFGTNV